MTKTATWSLLIVVLVALVVGSVLIYRDMSCKDASACPKFEWGLKPTTVEPFDMCFVMGTKGNAPAIVPCDKVEAEAVSGTTDDVSRADVLALTGSAERARKELLEAEGYEATGGVSKSSLLGETGGLQGVEVTGMGTRELSEANGIVGAGGGELWADRRGGEVDGQNFEGQCLDSEFQLGEVCCPKHLLPKDAVYGAEASSCLDWSCKGGYVKAASNVRCVLAGSTSADIIPGASPALDAIGIIEGEATYSDVVTVRVESGKAAEVGQGSVSIENEGSGKSQSTSGVKKSDRVFDFGPFDLRAIGGEGADNRFKVLIPFNAIAPRADKTIAFTFVYCDPSNSFYDVSDGMCYPKGDCTGGKYFLPGDGNNFGECREFTDCSGAPIRTGGDAESDRVCCPPVPEGGTWIYQSPPSTDPSCNQTCSTGGLSGFICPDVARIVPDSCPEGHQLSPPARIAGTRYYADADTDEFSYETGAVPKCIACVTPKPPNAVWKEGCNWDCSGALYRNNDRCVPYTAALGCGASNTENRVEIQEGTGDVTCCTPPGQGQKWAVPLTSATNQSMDLSPGVTGTTGACALACDASGGYFGSTVCARYAILGDTECEMYTSNGVNYVRGEVTSGGDVTCCSNSPDPAKNETWSISDDQLPTQADTRVIEHTADGNKQVAVLGACATKCMPGRWRRDGTDDACVPYDGWISGNQFSCPLYREGGTNEAPIYRMYDSRLQDNDDGIKCCDAKAENENWVYNYDAGQTWMTYPALNTSPVARWNSTVRNTNNRFQGTTDGRNYLGCFNECKDGYFRQMINGGWDAGECLQRGSAPEEENCSGQLAQSPGEMLRLSRRFSGYQGAPLECCAPLNDASGEMWKLEPATSYVAPRDISWNTTGAGSEPVDVSYGYYSRWHDGTTLCAKKCKDGYYSQPGGNTTDPKCAPLKTAADCPGGRVWKDNASITHCCYIPTDAGTFGTGWRWTKSYDAGSIPIGATAACDITSSTQLPTGSKFLTVEGGQDEALLETRGINDMATCCKDGMLAYVDGQSVIGTDTSICHASNNGGGLVKCCQFPSSKFSNGDRILRPQNSSGEDINIGSGPMMWGDERSGWYWLYASPHYSIKERNNLYLEILFSACKTYNEGREPTSPNWCYGVELIASGENFNNGWVRGCLVKRFPNHGDPECTTAGGFSNPDDFRYAYKYEPPQAQ